MRRRQPVGWRENPEAAPRERAGDRPMGFRRAADESAAVQIEQRLSAPASAHFPEYAADPLLAEFHAARQRHARALEHASQPLEIAHVAEARPYADPQQRRQQTKLKTRRQGASSGCRGERRETVAAANR